MSCIDTVITDHLKEFFRDMSDQTADKVHDGDCLLNVFFVLMPVVIKGDILSVIVQDALCRDYRTAKISADILKDFGRFTFFGFCIYVESVLMVPINSSFCLFKRVAKSFVQQAEESGLERVPEQLVVKVMDIPPEAFIAQAALRNKAVDVRVPLRSLPKVWSTQIKPGVKFSFLLSLWNILETTLLTASNKRLRRSRSFRNRSLSSSAIVKTQWR